MSDAKTSELSSRRRNKKAVFKLWCFCLVFLPLLLSLGFWQLERAEETQGALDLYLKNSNQATIDLTEYDIGDVDLFRPVKALGSFKQDRYLLDNRTRNGKAGYELLQLFETESHASFWVNRGWVQAPGYRSEAPQVDDLVNYGSVQIVGHFYKNFAEIEQNEPLVLAGKGSGPETIGKLVWPKRIQTSETVFYPNSSEETSRMMFRLVEGVSSIFPIGQTNALNMEWPETDIRPEKNLGYAFQWFAMSIALVLLTIFGSWKVLKETD